MLIRSFAFFLFTNFILLTDAAFAQEPVVTYDEIKPVLEQKCVMCHSSSMDLRTFPFLTSFPTQTRLVSEMIRRFRLATWQRMPPPRISAEPLTEEEIILFEQWLAAGLP